MRITIVLLLSFVAMTLNAQEASTLAVDKVVSRLASFYQLNAEQIAEMELIQAREARNVVEIASLRNNAPSEYLKRMQVIRESTQATTRRMLNEDQRQLFRAARQQERADWNARYKSLQAEGLTKAEIELKLTEQYLEEKGW